MTETATKMVAVRLTDREHAVFRAGLHQGHAEEAEALGAALASGDAEGGLTRARESSAAHRQASTTWLARAVGLGAGGRTLRTRIRGAIMGAIGGWKGAP